MGFLRLKALLSWSRDFHEPAMARSCKPLRHKTFLHARPATGEHLSQPRGGGLWPSLHLPQDSTIPAVGAIVDTAGPWANWIPSRAGGKPPQRSRLCKWPRCRGLPVREFDQHLSMTPVWSAPTYQVFIAQFRQCHHERRLLEDPCAVLGDDLVARAVAADDERIAPATGSADIDAIRGRLGAGLPGVENLGT